MCEMDTGSWNERLEVVQLCFNKKVRNRTGGTTFSLMFAHQVHIQGVNDKSNNLSNQSPLSIEELEKRAEYLNATVFPAIKERTMKIVGEPNKNFSKHYLVDIPTDTAVMIKLGEGRKDKLAPLCDGPYTVVRKTEAGTYVLKDESNELFHRNYVPSELKVVSIDETVIEDDIYQVEKNRDHRRCQETGEMEHLTKWAGNDERKNTWITADAFSSSETIDKYWKKLRHFRELEKERESKKDSVKKNSISLMNAKPDETTSRKKEKDLHPEVKVKTFLLKNYNVMLSEPRLNGDLIVERK